MENKDKKVQKRFYKQWWFWALLAVVFFILIGSLNSDQASDATLQKEDVSISETAAEETRVPAEYRSALSKATSYANTMHMSKRGVYDQLISEYGEKFTPEAAQYAVDNVKADWNANALVKAENYQETMHMSPAAIRDQLISVYGEKFTQAEADYAIQHLSN